MHIDPYIVLGSAIIGLLVGTTGAGGGALMTPMLILLFNVQPDKAISSDLVAAVLMRPLGAAVHFRKGTVNKRLVGLLAVGSVPMAFLGSYLLHLIKGNADSAQTDIERLLGSALARIQALEEPSSIIHDPATFREVASRLCRLPRRGAAPSQRCSGA